jgi:hypothetical protein
MTPAFCFNEKRSMVKNRISACLRHALIAAAAGGVHICSAQLVYNGSFESEPVGTTVQIGTNAVIDATTFSSWRVFSVGTPPMESFSAIIVTNASAGSRAMRLDMINTGGGQGTDHGLDRSNSKMPVTQEVDYILSFDAARISGSTNLQVTVAEFDSTGAFLGQQRVYSCSVTHAAYQSFVFDWTPLTEAAVAVNIAFRQQNSGEETSSSILLDNVQFTDNPAARATGGFYSSADSFARTNHLVSTSVFHWYTSAAGQQTGPWRPLEGRPAWTGEPDWWEGQVKQMMMANIDMLHVHLYPGMEQQRINLFQALNQLRYDGYDVPKVVPFLDPQITWNNQPLVDVATEAGKDEFASHYIRFYNQYYSANQDPYADDYLARFDERMVLDTWVVRNTVTNIPSLTNPDLTGRLAAAFGPEHSVFGTNVYMVTGVAGPTLGFADEKIVQFENNSYYYPYTYNGITTAQLKAGYWDQNIRTPGSFVARDGGLNFSNAWKQVDRSVLSRVYIESWNEYNEGSGIYAADPGAPYVDPAQSNTNTDTWSAGSDPYEYIRTTAAGAAAFNDRPNRDAKILWHDFPTHMLAGSTQAVTVVVRNEGDASWTAANNYKFGEREQIDPVLFGPNRYLLDDAADEIPVYGGIFRGRPVTFNLVLNAPLNPGDYETHWGMLQEGVAWFGEQIVQTITVTQTLYQVWAADCFTAGERADAAISGETADPDDDGFSNVEEYIAGTNPKDSQSRFIASSGFDAQNQHVLQWDSVSGRVYSIFSSSNLLMPFVLLEDNVQWPQSNYMDQAETEKFYKLNVQKINP